MYEADLSVLGTETKGEAVQTGLGASIGGGALEFGGLSITFPFLGKCWSNSITASIPWHLIIELEHTFGLVTRALLTKKLSLPWLWILTSRSLYPDGISVPVGKWDRSPKDRGTLMEWLRRNSSRRLTEIDDADNSGSVGIRKVKSRFGSDVPFSIWSRMAKPKKDLDLMSLTATCKSVRLKAYVADSNLGTIKRDTRTTKWYTAIFFDAHFSTLFLFKLDVALERNSIARWDLKGKLCACSLLLQQVNNCWTAFVKELQLQRKVALK